jgi:MFS transporter, putative metabolite:H+ symporter
LIGGGLGIGLLLLRVSVFESGMFKQAQKSDIQRGNFAMLFTDGKKLVRYINCILIGLPTWFVIGVLITFSPEFGKVLNFPMDVSPGQAVMFAYIGISVGDIATGLLSQWLKSRKKVVLIFCVLALLFNALYLLAPIKTMWFFYFTCFLLGFSMGYWALFVTIGAEQFGTNLRATVATTVPNFVRGSLPLIILAYNFTKTNMGLGTIGAAFWVGSITILIAMIALRFIDETFHKDLDYYEVAP